MRIAVTGATGFIGSALSRHLTGLAHDVVQIPRSLTQSGSVRFDNVDVVFHLAGLAHGLRPVGPDELFEINAALTNEVLDRARDASVKRFIFLSSIGVVAGNEGVLTPASPVRPVNDYGRSKASAEAFVNAASGIETVIVRPPLVYGAGAKGSITALRRLCLSRLPLPFGSVRNRRTMIGISNLVSALEFLATAPSSAVGGRTFHAVDQRDLSLREMIVTIRAGANLPPRLVSIPTSYLARGLTAIGRRELANQILDDLIVDGADLTAIGWRAPHDPSVDLLPIGR